MREIKFRAWNDIDKIMVDLQKITPFATELKGLFIPEAGVKEGHLIIEQFTGLQDKNGKEVFEGDRVRVNAVIGIVEFKDGCFDVLEKWIGCFKGDIEIIGNIHENPELMESDEPE